MKKFNYFDVLILVIIAIVISLFAFSKIVDNTDKNMSSVYLTLVVPSANINNSVYVGKKVYLNGVNNLVEIAKVSEIGDKLEITLISKGRLEGDVYIFNGQRVAINQPAEIHSNFVVKGHVVSVYKDEK